MGNVIALFNHLDQIDWLSQNLHPLWGSARFKHSFPEAIVLFATEDRIGKINVDPKRHGREIP